MTLHCTQRATLLGFVLLAFRGSGVMAEWYNGTGGRIFVVWSNPKNPPYSSSKQASLDIILSK